MEKAIPKAPEQGFALLARTYVILNEFAKEAVDFYKATVWPDILSLGISEDDFFEAVKACTVLRSKEK